MQFQPSLPTNPPYNMPMFFPQPVSLLPLSPYLMLQTPIQNQYPPMFNQPQAPQVNNFTGGPPTIYFKERKAKLNWQKLNSIDLERLHEPSNLHLLEACLGNITYAGLDQQDCEKFADPTLLKMFRLSQYSLEYLMNYQNHLYTQSQNLDMMYRQTEESLTPLEMKARENQAEIQRLREGLKKKKKTIDAYQHTLSTPLFRCTECKKYFKSQGYLDEHVLRRHSIIPSASKSRTSGQRSRVVLKDSCTSPLDTKQGYISTTKESIYTYPQSQEKGSSRRQDRGVLTENNQQDENRNINIQEAAAFETMKGFLEKIQREDNAKISQIDQMLKGKFDEIIRTNTEIGKRVQELEHKVDVRRLERSRQSASNFTEEGELDFNKENQNQLSNATEDHQEVLKDILAEKEDHMDEKPQKKPKMAGWIPYREAREAKKQGTDGRRHLRLEDDLKISEVLNEETPKDSDYKEVQHVDRRNEIVREDPKLEIHGRDFRQKEEVNDSDNIQIEDLEDEEEEEQHQHQHQQLLHQPNKESRNEEVEKRYENLVSLPREEHSQRQEMKREENQRQIRAEAQAKKENQRYNSQSFRSGGLEDDKVFKPSKASLGVIRAGKLEEDRNSDEDTDSQKKAQAVKLQRIERSESNRVHRRIEEVEEAHEGEPEFEDEDERERTIRIIESSIGVRGDEDRLLEKDRKAYMKAREAVIKKYLADNLDTKEVEVVQEQMHHDMKSRFNQLFGDDYDALAGTDVVNLEAILANLRNLNEKQKDRFTQMRQDYSKIQRKDVFMFDDKRPIQSSEPNENILPERSHIEEDMAIQAASNHVRRAKENLAELEQVIKESQESQSVRATPQFTDLY